MIKQLINKNANFALMLMVLFSLSLGSCSKKEEPIPVYEYTAPNYDVGHLSVKIIGNPGIVTNIEYKNLTKASTTNIDVGGFSYNQITNTSILSIPLASGNVNDQVQCCVSLSSAVNIGIEFINIPVDSITTIFTSSNIHCQAGNF